MLCPGLFHEHTAGTVHSAWWVCKTHAWRGGEEQVACMSCSEPDVVLYEHLSLGERHRIYYVDTSQFSFKTRMKTRRLKFPPKKLLHIIFKCVCHQHRVYGSGIINTVSSPHLCLSFLLSSSSSLSFPFHLFLWWSGTS